MNAEAVQLWFILSIRLQRLIGHSVGKWFSLLVPLVYFVA